MKCLKRPKCRYGPDPAERLRIDPRVTFDPQALFLISPTSILIITVLRWSLTHLQFNFNLSLTECYLSPVLMVSVFTCCGDMLLPETNVFSLDK